MWQDLSMALRDLRQASEPNGGSYRADLHYMRGPGPKWHAKHAMNIHLLPPKPRRCPSCAQPMPVIRTTERFGDLPVLHTFACRTCDVVIAHEAESIAS